MRTELVLDALEQAIWTRSREGVDDLTGWYVATTPGSRQYTFIAFTEQVAAAGAALSVGTVGDELDNVLAEFNSGCSTPN